jgi:endo-1,4-beta-xylanase
MNERDIPVRGHTMVWPGWKRLPPAVKELESDPSALREAIREHILTVGTALRGKVVDWDVVNEPFINNDLLKILGETEMAEWFKIARQADPTAKLYLNETSVPTSPPPDERYTVLYNQAKMIQDRGGPIDGVGMQAHFGQNVQPPVQLLKVYDRFATLGLPVRITELDIDIADETLQADYYRDFLTASFSHPNINGILIWGFWENAHWRPQAAMYRKDWSPRPIAGVWQQLVLKDWRTQAKGTSGSGEYRVRGFQGAYAVSVAAGGTEWSGNTSIDANGETLRVTLSK